MRLSDIFSQLKGVPVFYVVNKRLTFHLKCYATWSYVVVEYKLYLNRYILTKPLHVATIWHSELIFRQTLNHSVWKYVVLCYITSVKEVGGLDLSITSCIYTWAASRNDGVLIRKTLDGPNLMFVTEHVCRFSSLKADPRSDGNSVLLCFHELYIYGSFLVSVLRLCPWYLSRTQVVY